MTGADLLAFADSRQLNPYYLGYAIDTGAATVREAYERDGGNHLFVEWNTARWREQMVREGAKASPGWTAHETMVLVTSQTKAFERHCDVIADHLGDKLNQYITRSLP